MGLRATSFRCYIYEKLNDESNYSLYDHRNSIAGGFTRLPVTQNCDRQQKMPWRRTRNWQLHCKIMTRSEFIACWTRTGAVIPSFGAVLEGPGVFPSGIRTGYRTLRVMELSEPRVRLYGNIALVTTKVRLSGQLGGKSYDDLKMRQTDVWHWNDGAWKCVLTQEAVLKE